MLKGFKDFISRGNVIDLAVAVVIGAAFTGLVTSFTEKVVQPLVDRVGAGGDRQYGILKVSLGGDPEQFLDFNAVLSAFINFLIVAAVIYFIIVLPYKKLQGTRQQGRGRRDRADTAHSDPRPVVRER